MNSTTVPGYGLLALSMGRMKPATTVITWRGHSAERRKANCSASGATTPCSPIRHYRCSPPRPTIAGTRSSSRSRRSEERTTRAPALGTLRRELGMAGPRHDRVQPHRAAGTLASAFPRSSQHRNDPRPADQHRRTRRHVRPPNLLHLPAAWPWAQPWQRLFTAADRTTSRCLTAVHRRKAQPEPSESRADRQLPHTRNRPRQHEDQLDPAPRSTVDPGLGILLRTRCAPPPSCIISPTIVADVFSSTTQKVVKLLVGTGGYSPPVGPCTSRRGNDTPAIRARASSERFALVRANSRHTGRERKRRDQRRPDSETGPSYDVSVDSTPRPARTADRKPRPVSGIRVVTAQRQATHKGGRGRVYTDQHAAALDFPPTPRAFNESPTPPRRSTR